MISSPLSGPEEVLGRRTSETYGVPAQLRVLCGTLAARSFMVKNQGCRRDGEEVVPEPLLPASPRTEAGTRLALPSLRRVINRWEAEAWCAGKAGFEFVPEAEISEWLWIGLRGREIKKVFLFQEGPTVCF